VHSCAATRQDGSRAHSSRMSLNIKAISVPEAVEESRAEYGSFHLLAGGNGLARRAVFWNAADTINGLCINDIRMSCTTFSTTERIVT
jgi:hypothetical protein